VAEEVSRALKCRVGLSEDEW